MKKVLLLTDVNFWEKRSGNRMRIYSLIEYLAQHVNLTVVNTGPAPAEIDVTLADIFNAEFIVLEKTKYLNSNSYGRRLKAFLKNRHFDTIIIEYIHSSYFLNFLIEDATVILDAHDIISDRADDFKKFNYGGALYELSRETETEVMNVYDHIMVLCEPDLEKVNEMIGAGKAILGSHPVTPMQHTIRNEVKNIAFVGSAYLPNRDAIIFFIENCWPAIVVKYPVELLIYGEVGYGLDLNGQTNIVLKGFVPDVNQIYDEADIIINPVRFGAGLKIKNMEALAHGIPLVTTSQGARGLEAIKNNGFLVADNTKDFIAAVSTLMVDYDLRKKMSDCAGNYVKENFTAEKCFEPLMKIISS
jgi:glycosyltransferase involved in cell wall biosynthesis